MNQLPYHLGGHFNVTHIDVNTLLYMKKEFEIKSMYDVGCGPGGMVELALGMEIDTIGIDGDFTFPYKQELKQNIVIHDFVSGPPTDKNLNQRDFAWSCEFLEHVREEYMDNYFYVFHLCKYVVCTFATTYPGHHHVNVKDQQYWDHQFTMRGFEKNEEITSFIRRNTSMPREFVRNTGTFYINKAR